MLNRELAAYAVASALGAFIAIIVGYFVYAAPGRGVGFGYWFSHNGTVWLWAAAGLAVGSAARFLSR